jgi:hypothetical protein
MIATTAAATLSPAKFVRVVAALVRQFAGLVVGAEWGFMLADGFDVEAWVPRAGHLSLRLCAVEEDGTTGPGLLTVTVCPGVDRPFEVVRGDGLIIAETRGLDAAFSVALDEFARLIGQRAQAAHDVCAV